MYRKNRLRMVISAFLLLFLVACSGGGKTIQSYKDVPMHPQAKQLDIKYFESHPAVGPGWTIMNDVVQGGPFAGYQINGQGMYSISGQTPNPSIESFYDAGLSGWTKQKTTQKDELTGQALTVLSWQKDKQVVVVTTYSDGEQTILLPMLLQGK